MYLNNGIGFIIGQSTPTFKLGQIMSDKEPYRSLFLPNPATSVRSQQRLGFEAQRQLPVMLIMDVNYRRTLGVAAQTFVRDKWSAELVAEKYLKLIGGDIPENWWLDPKDVIYLQGCGQSEEQTKENIRRLVKAYGVKALQLSHRPHLEQAFLEFAGIKSA